MQPCDSIRSSRPTSGEVSSRLARVYTRPGCDLCDDAMGLLRKWGYQIEAIDIDEDPALREQFHECVPVVEIGGKIRFRGRVSEVLLSRLVHRTFQGQLPP